MLHVACCLWDANEKSQEFSRCYDESWVEKLYRGFKRNLSEPFRFVVFTDRERRFHHGKIEQERLATIVPDYGCLIEPFKLNAPTIICGLDTVVVRNLDHMAYYCQVGTRIAAPVHPTKPQWGVLNPVVFVPKGHRAVFDEWRGENDMEWLRTRDCVDASRLWPGQLLSLKLNIVPHGSTAPADARVIYFHGRKKPHELDHVGWIKKHWV